ncbi:MAG: hypothetical protein RLZZ292_3497 [Bacteroidota bacterium]|jgi:archaellin
MKQRIKFFAFLLIAITATITYTACQKAKVQEEGINTPFSEKYRKNISVKNGADEFNLVVNSNNEALVEAFTTEAMTIQLLREDLGVKQSTDYDSDKESGVPTQLSDLLGKDFLRIEVVKIQTNKSEHFGLGFSFSKAFQARLNSTNAKCCIDFKHIEVVSKDDAGTLRTGGYQVLTGYRKSVGNAAAGNYSTGWYNPTIVFHNHSTGATCTKCGANSNTNNNSSYTYRLLQWVIWTGNGFVSTYWNCP